MDDFSVIIRVKNEERYLGHAIQSVLDLLYKPEIIIVDNESTDMSSNIWGLFRQDSKLNSEDSRYAPFKEYNKQLYTRKSTEFRCQKCDTNKYINPFQSLRIEEI